MPLPIEDYAMIGDCQTAAIVGRDGSIDWACFPRFDSDACFAALLGSEDNGRWLLAPTAEVRRADRKYLGDTLVLETEFETDDGVVAVIDFMPIRGKSPDIVRIVEGRRGTVAMKSICKLRFEYGSFMPWVQRDNGGITAIAGPSSVHLVTDTETHGENMATVSEFTVNTGDRKHFVLTWYPSHEVLPDEIDAEGALEDTLAWWERWSAKCTYQGYRRDLVLRSLIVLKALTYMPTGGIVAAPTTSLPEQLGGVRNWDYRYCWLRDATLSLLALVNAGYVEEARAWEDWLLRAVAGDPHKTQIMYGIAGERRLEEYEVPWLTGYEGASPVRIGNAAYDQFQLDVYGEVCDALHQARLAGLEPAFDGWNLEKALLKIVEEVWDDPDEGIWEVRGPKRHFTHSKVMAWVAFDRAIKSAEQFNLEGPIDHWKQLRQKVHDRVMTDGFNAGKNSFTQAFGIEHLDSSLLVMPLVGFIPADDPKMVGTTDAIERELMRDGFLLRYDTEKNPDGLPPGEGAFLPCTFWLAENYAMRGETDRAKALYDRLAGLCNDVGLISEEYDPRYNRLVGNFPQAFTHIGLIATAMTISGHTGPCDRIRCT